MKRMSRAILLTVLIASGAGAQEKVSKVDDAGTLHLPDGEIIPYSDLASPEARKNFIDSTRGYEAVLAPKPANWKPKAGETTADQERRWYDAVLYIPWLSKLRHRFVVVIEPKTIGGVQTDIIYPPEGGSENNKERVLINLHGGGMLVGARYGGQLESIPISSIGRIRVVTVDYRMLPHKYPAAEEDVIAVYRELLKTYRPENIGIYGCSAGASLTGSVVARLIASGQPKPGAIGMFGYGPFGRRGDGDSNYIFAGGKALLRPDSYTADVDMDNHASYPLEAPEIQRQFPPALLISGTRDLGLSRVVFAHSLLVNLGVDAELHVWEGVQHCSFAQPFVDPDVPETQQAWKTIIQFFDNHLGRSARQVDGSKSGRGKVTEVHSER
jgi:monoterpene epsilon-lactone hydrolase